MNPNFDEIDRAILRELQHDARRANKALAESVGVSPSTMVNRVRALEESGAIRGYHADVDPTALGRNVDALISVRLQPKTPATVDAFIEAVWQLEETVAVSLVTGSFDALIHLSVANIASLSETVMRGIASAPGVVDEQTSIVFEHRRRSVLEPSFPAQGVGTG